MTTVAKTEASPTPMATVVKMATVAELATHANLTTVDNLATLDKLTGVKGELRVPNTIFDSLLPTLEPAAALLYLRLYRLSHGYKKETCIVGLQKLATATNTSERTVQRAIEYLERRRPYLPRRRQLRRQDQRDPVSSESAGWGRRQFDYPGQCGHGSQFGHKAHPRQFDHGSQNDHPGQFGQQ